jgi:hypothetical protein
VADDGVEEPVVIASRHRSLLCVSLLIAAASCRATPTDCKHDSTERCLWEQAVVTPGDSDGELDAGELGGDSDGPDPSEKVELEHTLMSMIDIMQLGLEWPLVDQRARALCSQRDEDGELMEGVVQMAEPTEADETDDTAKETAPAWSCSVAGLELDGTDLTLEASQGVISLSAIDLDTARSEQLVERALTRFAQKCQGKFEEIEGAKLEVFHRCALPEGPYLVIARFPRDPEANRWQVSIAVVDAG